MRQFFQDPPSVDGKTPGPSVADDNPRNVLDVGNVDDGTKDGNSTTTLTCNVVECPLQGPVSTNFDRSASSLSCVGGVDHAHVQQSEEDAVRGDVIEDPTKASGLGSDKSVNDVQFGGIECHRGAHYKTGALVAKATSDDQATKSHPLGYCEDTVVEDKRVETLETRTLAAGRGEEVRTDPEASTPHISAGGKLRTGKSAEGSAAKNTRVSSVSTEVEPTKDGVTYGRTAEVGQIDYRLGEARTVDGNHSNGVADSDCSVKTNPKQALFLKHELAIGSPSKNRVTEIEQAGGELREKGHSRNPSVESQLGLMPTTTTIVSDTTLEEGGHHRSRIPFPGGNRSPKFFTWSGDGHIGPYFVFMIEQSHARSGGLAVLLGLLIYAACGWWS